MRDAVAALVRDGDTVVIEGFTHLICFAAGHEIIRQRRRDLTLCRLTPDLIYDQMIAAGLRPEAGLLLGRQSRRGLAARLPPRGGEGRPAARAGGVLPLRHGRPPERRRGAAAVLDPAGLHGHRPADRQSADPDGRPVPTPARCWPPFRRSIPTSPSCTPSAPTPQGNTQIWGLLGVQKEAALASERVIVVVEELVDRVGHPRRSQPHGDPGPRGGRGGGGAVGRAPVLRPGLLRPGQRLLRRLGADLARPRRRCTATSTSSSSGCKDRAEYVERCGGLERLRASSRVCAGVNYGY